MPLFFFHSSHFSPYQATGWPNVWTVSNPPLLIFLFYWLIYLFSCSTEKWLYSSYFSPCPGFREKELMHPRFWLLACVSLFFFFIFFISMSPFSFLGILRATPTFSVKLNECIIQILPLPFCCALRSVAQRISGGGVDASESHLSPWHWRAQSQCKRWDIYRLQDFLWPDPFCKKKLRRINKKFKLLRIIVMSSGWLSHSSLKHLIAGVITLYS